MKHLFTSLSWAITYGPHMAFGSSDKLYQITPDKKLVVRSESIGTSPYYSV